MTTSPRFWNWMAKRYARQPIEDENAYQHKLEVTQGFLRPSMKVLEFGCGTGSTALIHAPHVAHIDAIDYSRKMIDIAREKAKTQGVENVTFEIATIEEWPAKDHSYDVILGLNILHLLEDKETVLSKVHQLLKPGGIFISSTACLSEIKGAMKWLISIGSALGVLPLVRTFSGDQLLESIRRHGFSIENEWSPQSGISIFIVAKATGT
jgi:2-polyprenyl-3-methyl-5-hydroxy-6-metoxy-1,4-benzoquinol methylase